MIPNSVLSVEVYQTSQSKSNLRTLTVTPTHLYKLNNNKISKQWTLDSVKVISVEADKIVLFLNKEYTFYTTKGTEIINALNTKNDVIISSLLKSATTVASSATSPFNATNATTILDTIDISNLDNLEYSLVDELLALDMANIHQIIQSEHSSLLLLDKIDETLKELSSIEEWLSLYQDELQSTGRDIHSIERENRHLQIETRNQQQLKSELESVLSQLEVDASILDTLTRSKSISELETCCHAIQAVLSRKFDIRLSGISERQSEIVSVVQVFSKRLVERVIAELSGVVSDLPTTLSQLTSLLQYNKLLSYLKEFDARLYSELQLEYCSLVNKSIRIDWSIPSGSGGEHLFASHSLNKSISMSVISKNAKAKATTTVKVEEYLDTLNTQLNRHRQILNQLFSDSKDNRIEELYSLLVDGLEGQLNEYIDACVKADYCYIYAFMVCLGNAGQGNSISHLSHTKERVLSLYNRFTQDTIDSIKEMKPSAILQTLPLFIRRMAQFKHDPILDALYGKILAEIYKHQFDLASLHTLYSLLRTEKIEYSHVKKEYEHALNDFVDDIVKKVLGRMFVFFNGVIDLMKHCSKDEVSYHIQFNKNNMRKNILTPKELKRNVETVRKKKIELENVVIRGVIEGVIRKCREYETLVEECYGETGVIMAVEDVIKCFD